MTGALHLQWTSPLFPIGITSAVLSWISRVAGCASWPCSGEATAWPGCHSKLIEPLDSQMPPIRELVAPIPTPGCNHGQHEDPTVAQQIPIELRILFAHLLGGMCHIELDRTTTASLQVHEEQPVVRPHQVA